MNLDWQTDGWIIVAGSLCAIAASLLGNFLVLRRLSLMGDAISHSVLPGIAAAFLFSGTRGSVVVLIGAASMGLLAASRARASSKTSSRGLSIPLEVS